MHWDEQEIIRKHNYIENLYNKEKKPILKKMLYNDLCTLSAMKSLYDPRPFEIDEREIHEDDNHVNVPELENKLSKIIITLNEYMSIRIRNKKPRNIIIDDYNSLLNNFFENYHPQLIDVYNQLNSEKKIELNSNKKFEPSQRGECLFVRTLNEFFIYGRYNGKLLSSHYLPHELGHAYQAYELGHVENSIKKRHSLFVEVYSTYIEQLYVRYLKDIGYAEQSRYLEKQYWEVFSIMIESQMMFLLNRYQFMDCINLKYIFSMLLSNLFYEEYLKNGNHNMINEFNEIFKEGNDMDIIKEYKLERILNSGQKAFERIL